ncbi:MAG TPA: N-acetyl-gamma-glutamyl-phosphate reductase [Labilithrix sp.]|nr:N-acetyl-gamma-glutamyl-phosphate reductase [Labilithrix sp.]
MRASLGLVGARGYVGRELVKLVEKHGELDVRLAISQRDGKSPSDVAETKLDAYVLALPNGASEPYVEAITAAQPSAIIVDLSADHRFDAAWVYGQPERKRAAIAGARRIANPGCYATAMQLALAPLVPLLEGPANVFGVSGYSGAGTTPSPKNDPEALRDNLMPYALVGHLHEREVAAQLGCRLFFMPHVAPFFQGVTVTVSVALAQPCTRDALAARFREAYGAEPLVRVQDEIPLVRDIVGRHDVVIGGLTVSEDGRHAVVVATIDNLLGGAASQALRNLNLALGFAENQGVLS